MGVVVWRLASIEIEVVSRSVGVLGSEMQHQYGRRVGDIEKLRTASTEVETRFSICAVRLQSAATVVEDALSVGLSVRFG
ncbi:unnamed protein product [Linum trigynum]|uniref:Uncharacterized protein n=1 Tax=Linum trigynum TaxID=586398 RepID=A0AAV2E7R7_9ROSI